MVYIKDYLHECNEWKLPRNKKCYAMSQTRLRFMDDLIVEQHKENSQDGEEGENGAGEDLPLRLNFFETFIVHI